MGWLSVNNNYKYRAEGAIREAEELVGIQQDRDFGQNLLANIRQYRIAKEQLEAYGDTDDVASSTSAGVSSNVKSTLAGEVGYAYETSNRAEQIQQLQTFAQQQLGKYKQQVKRASRNADILSYGTRIAGAAIGFVVSGFNPAGAVAGWQIGGMAAAPTTFILGGDSVAMKKNLGVSVSSAISYGVTSYINAPVESGGSTSVGGLGSDSGFAYASGPSGTYVAEGTVLETSNSGFAYASGPSGSYTWR